MLHHVVYFGQIIKNDRIGHFYICFYKNVIICCNNFINSSLLITKDIKGRFSISKMSRLSLAMGLTILIIFSALVPGITVLAADTAEGTTIGDISDPGILPDSGFYFIKSWGRNLQLMFARTDAERARLMLKYTSEDALALEKMYQMGKYDVAANYAAFCRNYPGNEEPDRSAINT